ncbi:MAG: cadherin repeat domain-containing protein, partial [Magnetococcales bacterium]|nr:cadherin repeat domain-containing protein [Magnetococcales bacterium]
VVTASDGTLTDSQTVAITVANDPADDIPLDIPLPPTITSASVASWHENATGMVYLATAVDPNPGTTIQWSLGGTDAALFAISASGVVSFVDVPDFETPVDAGADNVYHLMLTASDGVLTDTRAVAITLVNLDEVAPIFISGAIATSLDENSGPNPLVYTALAADDKDYSQGVTYSLKSGDDAAAFSIHAATGAVTLTGNPDYETKASYAFTVIASDGVHAGVEKAVTLAITNLDEVAPMIISSATATPILEMSGAGRVVYSALATDAGDVSTGVTFSLKSVDDFASFTISAMSGDVTLIDNPDFETKAGYSFTVVATDGAGHAVEQSVVLGITDMDESVLTITSGSTAPSLNENSGADASVYTVITNITDGVTYSLKPGVGDFSSFSIDDTSGVVRLTGNPDFESQASYAFTVVATRVTGSAVEQAVTLAITNLDEVAPSFSSAGTATPV